MDIPFSNLNKLIAWTYYTYCTYKYLLVGRMEEDGLESLVGV